MWVGLWLVACPGTSAQTVGEEPEPPPRNALIGPRPDVSPLVRPDNPAAIESAPRPVTLTRDWFGAGVELEQHGLAFDLNYVADIVANVSGGLDTGVRYLDQVDLGMTFDPEPWIGLRGATAFVLFRGNHGGKPTEQLVGDAQVVSNIEVLADDLKLYEAWYEQRLLEDRLSFRAGLYDLNTEFDVIETASLFLNSSQGIGADFAQSGENGPSIFPYTGLAFRAAARPWDSLTIRAAVLEGKPGDPEDPKDLTVRLRSDEGVLLVSEVDWITRPMDTLELRCMAGFWTYTAAFENLRTGDTARGNRGAYVMVEGSLSRAESVVAQELRAFVRFGVADERYNAFGHYLGAGVVVVGPVPGRGQDRLGLALARALTGHEARCTAEAAGTPLDRAETKLELTYRAEITPWFAVQPDLQYILHPGVGQTGAAGHALVVGVRFDILF